MTIYSIAYRTDLNLLKDTREKTAQIIDYFHDQVKLGMKQAPNNSRTYRKKVRKDYLVLAKQKTYSRKKLCKAIGKQLLYLKRNLSHITSMIESHEDYGTV